jgi:hypothetical protein
MKNGMYGIAFQATQDHGEGVLTFEDGIVYGVDVAGVKYDGDYIVDETTGLALVRLKVTYPPNVTSVFGVENPYEWSIDVQATIDPRKDVGEAIIRTSIGQPLKAQYRYMRSLPIAA